MPELLTNIFNYLLLDVKRNQHIRDNVVRVSSFCLITNWLKLYLLLASNQRMFSYFINNCLNKLCFAHLPILRKFIYFTINIYKELWQLVIYCLVNRNIDQFIRTSKHIVDCWKWVILIDIRVFVFWVKYKFIVTPTVIVNSDFNLLLYFIFDYSWFQLIGSVLSHTKLFISSNNITKVTDRLHNLVLIKVNIPFSKCCAELIILYFLVTVFNCI